MKGLRFNTSPKPAIFSHRKLTISCCHILYTNVEMFTNAHIYVDVERFVKILQVKTQCGQSIIELDNYLYYNYML
jgi:hypothetical protein